MKGVENTYSEIFYDGMQKIQSPATSIIKIQLHYKYYNNAIIMLPSSLVKYIGKQFVLLFQAIITDKKSHNISFSKTK